MLEIILTLKFKFYALLYTTVVSWQLNHYAVTPCTVVMDTGHLINISVYISACGYTLLSWT